MRLLNRCEASSIIPDIINIAVPHAQYCAAGISGSAGARRARRVRPVVGWGARRGARQRELNLVSSDLVDVCLQLCHAHLCSPSLRVLTIPSLRVLTYLIRAGLRWLCRQCGRSEDPAE